MSQINYESPHLPERHTGTTDNFFITDLHTHNKNYAFIFDEKIPYDPTELVHYAKAANLGGIAITGHDTFKGCTEAVEAGEEHDMVISTGIEVTTSHFTHKHGLRIPHIIGILPTDEALRLERKNKRFGSGKKPTYVAELIKDHGGVVIIPHPTKKGNFCSLSYKQIKKYRDIIDGVETRTRVRQISDELDAIVTDLGLSHVGSSDTHEPEHLGSGATEVPRITGMLDSNAVIEAIRNRTTRALMLREHTENDFETPLESQLRRGKQMKEMEMLV